MAVPRTGPPPPPRISSESGTKRKPRSRKPLRIAGSASCVFQPRPLMWKTMIDPARAWPRTARIMAAVVVLALGSPETTSQVTVGRFLPVDDLDDPPVPVAERRAKGDRAPAVAPERRLGLIDLLADALRRQLGHVGVIVRVVAELDQRIAGQVDHRLGVGVDPAAGDEDGGRHLLALEDVEHVAIEPVPSLLGGTGVEGDRHLRLAHGDARDRARQGGAVSGGGERRRRERHAPERQPEWKQRGRRRHQVRSSSMTIASS